MLERERGIDGGNARCGVPMTASNWHAWYPSAALRWVCHSNDVQQLTSYSAQMPDPHGKIDQLNGISMSVAIINTFNEYVWGFSPTGEPILNAQVSPSPPVLLPRHRFATTGSSAGGLQLSHRRAAR